MSVAGCIDGLLQMYPEDKNWIVELSRNNISCTLKRSEIGVQEKIFHKQDIQLSCLLW